MKRLLIVIVSVGLISAPTRAAEATPALDPAKEKQIRTLLELTQMTVLIQSMTDQVFDSFRTTFPDVKPEAWQRLRAKMPAEELIELVIPIYDRYYTTEDLAAVIAFYQTPVGQKVIRTLPAITRESGEVGERWGLRKAEEVIEELKAEGLIQE